MRNRKRLTSRRPTSKRLTKRELKRDRFVDTIFDWALWSRENVRKVAVAAGAVALLVLAVLVYRGSHAGEGRRAGQRYDEIWQAYLAGNFQLAANDFRQFRLEFAGSDYGDEATLYLADSYYQAGDHPAAIKVLQEFDQDYHDSPLSYAAAGLLGAAYESSGDWVKAAETYGEAGTRGRYDYQKIEALLNQARAHAAGGSKDKAATAYREAIEKYPESPRLQEARVRLGELTAEPLGETSQPTVQGDSTMAVAATSAAADSGVVGVGGTRETTSATGSDVTGATGGSDSTASGKRMSRP